MNPLFNDPSLVSAGITLISTVIKVIHVSHNSFPGVSVVDGHAEHVIELQILKIHFC